MQSGGGKGDYCHLFDKFFNPYELGEKVANTQGGRRGKEKEEERSSIGVELLDNASARSGLLMCVYTPKNRKGKRALGS